MQYLKKYKKYFLAMAFYLFLSVLLTWPLILNINKGVVGEEGDNLLFVWNHWHVGHSLVNFQNPYFTDLIAYPLTSNLVFHTLTIFNSFLSSVLQLFLPLVLSFNIIFILSLAVAALGMFLLSDYIFRHSYAAFFTGVVFAFNAYIFGEAQGHFQYTSIYIIPFYILFYLKLFKEGKYKNAIFAAILLAISFYNDFYYSIGLILFSVLFAAWMFGVDKKTFVSNIKKILLLFFVFIILSLPLIFLSVKTVLQKEIPSTTLGQINLFTPDIRSLFIPSHYQTSFGKHFVNYYSSLGFHGGIIYPSFILILLSLLGYFYEKNEGIFKGRFLAWGSFFFLVMALGPFLFWDGYVFNAGGVLFTIPLPYLLFYSLPFMNGILVPPRFIIFSILFLAILSGYFLKNLFKKIEKMRMLSMAVLFLVIGVYLFEVAAIPFPITSTKVPEFYYELGKDEGEYAIMELPFALSTSFYTLGLGDATPSKTEYYQTVHKKKILSAWISRVPADYYNFFNSLTGLNFLINSDESAIKEVEKNREKIKSDFKKLNIQYIIIHPEYYNHIQLRDTINIMQVIYKIKPKLINNMLVYKL